MRIKAKPAKAGSRRAQKSEQNRHALLQGAAAVVGEQGYAGASIALITQRAGLAQGTFYLYFESREDLFNQLLPEVGQELLDFLGERVHGAKDIFEIEERAFRASCEFLATHPGFYRILNEAEAAAPKAYEQHFNNVAKRYLQALRRAHADGGLKGYSEREIEVLVYMLMGARSYINVRFGKELASRKQVPKWIVEAYMKVVRAAFDAEK
jgi:AcrR family transcriptional regulator